MAIKSVNMIKESKNTYLLTTKHPNKKKKLRELLSIVNLLALLSYSSPSFQFHLSSSPTLCLDEGHHLLRGKTKLSFVSCFHLY